MKKLTVFNRSCFVLGLGCALASLPVSVRAQDEPAAPTAGPSQVEATRDSKPEPDATPTVNSSVKSNAGKSLPKVAADQKLSASDKVIARKFANINQSEVEEGKLALTNAESQEIKDYAQKMVDVHGKSNEELVALANAHGMDLKPTVDQSEQATYAKMKQLKGTNFDGMYAKHAAAAHADAVKEFEKDEKKIQNKELLAYAEKTLPDVKEHEKMAQGLKGAASVGGEIKDAKKKKAE